MEKELTVDLVDTLSVAPTVVVSSVVVPSVVVSPVVVSSVVVPSVVVSSVVVPSVSVPSVMVITDVLHSGPLNPGAHSTPSLTFTFTLSIISIKPVLSSVPSGDNVSENLTKPSSAPLLVMLINSPILGFADEYSGLRLSQIQCLRWPTSIIISWESQLTKRTIIKVITYTGSLPKTHPNMCRLDSGPTS